MLSSFLLLVFLTLSASSPRILTETQSIQPAAEDKESPFLAQRMLQDQQPVLISVQQITIPPPFGPPPGMPGGPPPGMPPGGPPGGGPPPGMPPGGPPGGGPPQPIVVTTKTYALDIENEGEILIVVEDNQNPLEAIEAIGDEQPQIANGDDVFISSWWTFEGGETAFESWDQLESYIGAQYGLEPTIGIDVDVEDVPVEIEIVVAENTEFPPPSQGTQNINEDLSTGVINVTTVLQNISAVNWGLYEQEEIEGVDLVYSTNVTAMSPRKCNQVESCQKVFVKSLGLRDVCKVQLVCPKV